MCRTLPSDSAEIKLRAAFPLPPRRFQGPMGQCQSPRADPEGSRGSPQVQARTDSPFCRPHGHEITAMGETGKLTHHVYNVGPPRYKLVEIRPSTN